MRLSHLRSFFDRIIEWGYPDAPTRNPVFAGDMPILYGTFESGCFHRHATSWFSVMGRSMIRRVEAGYRSLQTVKSGTEPIDSRTP
jgi:hypothetical protein